MNGYTVVMIVMVTAIVAVLIAITQGDDEPASDDTVDDEAA
jgi:hypothetical protein